MNTWYYDGIMPEYMFHNHELLSGGGQTVREWFFVQGRFFANFGPAFLALVAGLFLLSTHYPELQSSERNTPLELYVLANKEEKPGMKKDWAGTSIP